MPDGSFSLAARAEVMGRHDGRCVGCGRPATNVQHRIARGMGGTSRGRLGHPANGLPMCGSGTTGCHGWAEAHPVHALALGWRLEQGTDPVRAAYWTQPGAGPWRWSAVTEDGHGVYVDPDDLQDHLTAHDVLAATNALREFASTRTDR